jgi:hypothetical protein
MYWRGGVHIFIDSEEFIIDLFIIPLEGYYGARRPVAAHARVDLVGLRARTYVLLARRPPRHVASISMEATDPHRSWLPSSLGPMNWSNILDRWRTSCSYRPRHASTSFICPSSRNLKVCRRHLSHNCHQLFTAELCHNQRRWFALDHHRFLGGVGPLARPHSRRSNMGGNRPLQGSLPAFLA